MTCSLYLASASPRRAELLEQIGVSFEQIKVEVDETPVHGESPTELTCRLAAEKAAAGVIQSRNSPVKVLAGDTVVVIDDMILGKPQDAEEAMQMLTRLAGRTHEVYSAVAISDSECLETRLNVSRVTFAPLTREDIQAYIETGEYLGRSGSYAIQGRGACLVKRLEGSYSGVMGLPLYETSQLLARFGLYG
ncbi:MAG: septum formation inhibitor Maf [Gammaproteobacteria bacterium]|nr:MAG: septum formation inhibitor Maf [Gammaproteobacteria bacterium]